MSFHELQAQKSDARRRLISARVNRLCTKAERVWSLITVALAFFVFFIFFIMNIHTELHISPRFIMSGYAVSFFPPLFMKKCSVHGSFSLMLWRYVRLSTVKLFSSVSAEPQQQLSDSSLDAPESHSFLLFFPLLHSSVGTSSAAEGWWKDICCMVWALVFFVVEHFEAEA